MWVIGNYVITTTTFIRASAFIISSLLAVDHIKRRGLDPAILYNTGFAAIISGIFGSHMLVVLLNLRSYLKHPIDIFALGRGGFSAYGALLFAGIGAYIYLRIKRLSVNTIGDLLAPYAALALAIARISCFIGGCCYGKEAACGIWGPVMKKILIPTQLISSLALLLIFVALRLLQERPHKDGQVLYLLFVLYGIKRFLIEFWRGDTHQFLWGLTLFQCFSILLIGFACVQLMRLQKKARPTKK